MMKHKRAAFPRKIDFSRDFKKDWKRLSQSGRYDLSRLKEAILLLTANDGPLGAEWFDHALKGKWSGFRECHIGGDFLLIYQLSEDGIVFVRTGTHAELFGR